MTTTAATPEQPEAGTTPRTPGPGVIVEEGDPGTLRIVLARPDHGNAFDLPFAQSFADAVTQVEARVRAGGITCVLLTAQGRHFCVGGDLQDFPSEGEAARTHITTMITQVNKAMTLLYELPVPLVTRVQGAAAGAGVGLAACGDIVIAARSARFRAAYTAVGLSPDCATSWLLPRAVGLQRANDMVFTNRPVPAEEAASWGLVSRVVEDDILDEEVSRVLAALSASIEPALATSKRLLRKARENGLAEHLTEEARGIADLAAHPQAVELRRAFLAS